MCTVMHIAQYRFCTKKKIIYLCMHYSESVIHDSELYLHQMFPLTWFNNIDNLLIIINNYNYFLYRIKQ